jgi:hypothetical protein
MSVLRFLSTMRKTCVCLKKIDVLSETNQVISYALAEQLRDAGFPQGGHGKWIGPSVAYAAALSATHCTIMLI